MNAPGVNLKVSAREAKAILIGLNEYLYIVEEGNLEEVLAEMESLDHAHNLDATGTASLIMRIQHASQSFSGFSSG